METQNKIADQKMASKIRGAMLTGALGDALGVSTEMTEQNFLKEKYGRISTFLPTKENLFFSKNGFDSDGIGYYSDDTVLTFAIAKSLAENGEINLKDMFQKHIEGYKAFPYGFGKSTKNAFTKIEAGMPLEEISNPDGGGNGMMMKQFPLAAYFTINDFSPEVEEKAILDITKVSHAYPAALVAAIVHHNFLKILLQSDLETFNKKETLQLLKSIAEEQEKKYPEWKGKKISEILEEISSYIYVKKNELNMTDKEILEYFGWKGDTIKNSGFITTTLGIVYCLFLRNTGFTSVRDAVNFGGDTDTYASIIGNMSGALQGEIYDEKLLNSVQNIEDLKKQTNAFIIRLLGK